MVLQLIILFISFVSAQNTYCMEQPIIAAQQFQAQKANTLLSEKFRTAIEAEKPETMSSSQLQYQAIFADTNQLGNYKFYNGDKNLSSQQNNRLRQALANINSCHFVEGDKTDSNEYVDISGTLQELAPLIEELTPIKNKNEDSFFKRHFGKILAGTAVFSSLTTFWAHDHIKSLFSFGYRSTVSPLLQKFFKRNS